MIATVVSAVRFRDAKVWKVAARQVMANIPARRYLAIVPDHEVEPFRKIAPDGYDIEGDKAWLGGLDKGGIRQLLPDSVKDRDGWYVQQFVKIAAAASGADDDINLIWDGDTIPLKPLRFVGEDGALRYYRASENHRPYFEIIETLLGVKKITDFSFVAQCLPVRASWARAAIARIETRRGKDWRLAVLELLPGRHVSEFSEYETLGQYAAHFHSAEMRFNDGDWHRYGLDFVSAPAKLSPRICAAIGERYDYLTFEHWDRSEGFEQRRNRFLNRLAIRIQSLRTPAAYIRRSMA